MRRETSRLPENTFRLRLKEQRKKHALSQQECADIFGIAQSTVGNWETGVREPCYDMLLKIIDYFRISADYMLGLTDVERPMERLKEALQTTQKGRKIPIFRRVASIETIGDIIGFEEMTPADSGEYFGLRVCDEGMAPRIFGGDIVIVRRQSGFRDGRVAVVTIGETEAICRKVVRHESGLSFVAMNSVYEPQFFTNEEVAARKVRLYGEVVEVRSRL